MKINHINLQHSSSLCKVHVFTDLLLYFLVIRIFDIINLMEKSNLGIKEIVNLVLHPQKLRDCSKMMFIRKWDFKEPKLYFFQIKRRCVLHGSLLPKLFDVIRGRIQGRVLGVKTPPFSEFFFQFTRVFKENIPKTPPKFSRSNKEISKPLPRKIFGYAPGRH